MKHKSACLSLSPKLLSVYQELEYTELSQDGGLEGMAMAEQDSRKVSRAVYLIEISGSFSSKQTFYLYILEWSTVFLICQNK